MFLREGGRAGEGRNGAAGTAAPSLWSQGRPGWGTGTRKTGGETAAF